VRTFFLTHEQARRNAISEIARAPDGYVVKVSEPTRSNDQNARFHAICNDLARSELTWAGKRRTLAQWKALLVSGHAVATKEQSEIVPGIEGEFINIRESTALMSKRRSSSLIEYAQAFCAMNGVRLAIEVEASA
jgi:NinB protein